MTPGNVPPQAAHRSPMGNILFCSDARRGFPLIAAARTESGGY